MNIDKNLLKQYFYYGIINKQELEEGLLFYILSKIHKEPSTISEKDYINYKEIPTENFTKEEKEQYYAKCRQAEQIAQEKMKTEHMKKLIQEATSLYKQYYRFIVFPDNKENYNMEITEEMLKQIKIKVEENIEKLRQNGKITVFPAGIYFNREQEEFYNEKWNLEDIKTYKMNHYKNWTQYIYEVLVELKKLESEDIKKYQETWIDVRLKRAENRTPKDDIEVRNIQTLQTIFEKKKEAYNGQKDRSER